MAKKTVYLINPKNDFPNYYGAEVLEADLRKTAVAIADLAVSTVATLMRPYFNVILCEQHVTQVDFDLDVDFVAITGKITQWEHGREIASRFRERGIPVIIGGPFASLSPDTVRPYADILVTGEMEEIADDVFSEIASGKWRDRYIGVPPDLSKSVMPAWDLYPNERSLAGNLQVSRGCPFQCEFCDVIQYLGRKQRHKPISKVLAELDRLHEIGYINSLIADDNFTVYRQRAKEVLKALEEWNNAVPGRTHKFVTQLSMDITRDEEMLEMMNRAGVANVFIGIETPNEESLKETRKFQNTKIDIAREIEKFYKHGIGVSAGLIVGFDNDDLSIFERQFEFAMDSSIPFFSLNFLVAMESTPLYAKMKKQGRIRPPEEMHRHTQFETNVRFRNMDVQEQHEGMKWLLTNIYAPQNFGERLYNMIDKLGESKVVLQSAATRTSYAVKKDMTRVIRNLRKRGPEEEKMYDRVTRKMEEKPNSSTDIMTYLFQYAQVRHMLDNQPEGREKYDPKLIGTEPFALA